MKKKVNCIVCGGLLAAQTINISEDDETGESVEELDGYGCVDCGIKYHRLPKQKVVTQKTWEAKLLEELGG